MGRIIKSEEERGKIQAYVINMSTLFFSAKFENPQLDVQSIFDKMYKDLYVNSGTIYLCFTCASIIPREDVRTRSYFQIKRVWHNCIENIPTVGVVTRWEKVLKHIDELYVDENNN